jgi:hypothetical protein
MTASIVKGLHVRSLFAGAHVQALASRGCDVSAALSRCYISEQSCSSILIAAKLVGELATSYDDIADDPVKLSAYATTFAQLEKAVAPVTIIDKNLGPAYQQFADERSLGSAIKPQWNSILGDFKKALRNLISFAIEENEEEVIKWSLCVENAMDDIAKFSKWSEDRKQPVHSRPYIFAA